MLRSSMRCTDGSDANADTSSSRKTESVAVAARSGRRLRGSLSQSASRTSSAANGNTPT